MKLAAYKIISKQLYADIEAAAEKHGLKLAKLRAGVEEALGEVRLTITLQDTQMKAADGSATSPEIEAWRQLAALCQLKPEWLGQQVNIGRARYTIAGLRNTHGGKPVVLARVPDGRAFVATAEQLRRAMGDTTAPPSRSYRDLIIEQEGLI